MTVAIHCMVPEAVAARADVERIAARMGGDIAAVHREDISVNEGPWRGLRAPLATQGPLSLLEAALWQMNQWWAKRLSATV